MEHLAQTGGLTDLIDELARLTLAQDARLRSDACYYLSLSGSAKALPVVEALLDDSDAEVREIAKEAKEALTSAAPQATQ